MESQMHIEIGVDNINLGADSLFVYHPRFVDEEKKRIRAIVRKKDGTFAEMDANRDDKHSPLIRDVFLQYSEVEIEMYTHRERCMIDKRRQLEKRIKEDNENYKKKEEVFQAKADAMKIEKLKEHPRYKEVLRSIRKGKNAFEVMALTVAALNEVK